MRADRWAATLDHAARVHRFSAAGVADVCREELLAPGPLADSA
ncbi:MAG TPA: hypothetical protein VM263_07480 [Acidimicrobiales bacterium]|nr:hypothetical protein [Acidimicrobiales bacterium]